MSAKNGTMKKKNKLPKTRMEMLELAKNKVNAHFLTNYKTHEEIMADKRTSAAMIGFMICWDLLK